MSEKDNNPTSGKNALIAIIVGVLGTVIGGIILAYIIQDARFDPNRIADTIGTESFSTPSNDISSSTEKLVADEKFSEASIWKPDPSCMYDNMERQNMIRPCLNEMMSDSNLDPAARLAFDLINGDADSYASFYFLVDFVDFGEVDLITLSNPMLANSNTKYALVNGNPEFFDVRTDISVVYDHPEIADYISNHENAGIDGRTIFDRRKILDNGHQQFIFRLYLINTDNGTLEFDGTLFFGIEFNSAGDYIKSVILEIVGE